MIILIGSEIGGCGKSIIATNICSALAQDGKDVILVDADQQGTAADWADERSGNTALPAVRSIQEYGDIKERLEDLNTRHQFVIVDVRGAASKELRSGMSVADILLIPVVPSTLDLGTLPALQEEVAHAKAANPKLNAYSVLSKVSTKAKSSDVADILETFKDYPEINRFKTVICGRKAYKDAIMKGRGVLEMSDAKAVSEIQSLMGELL